MGIVDQSMSIDDDHRRRMTSVHIDCLTWKSKDDDQKTETDEDERCSRPEKIFPPATGKLSISIRTGMTLTVVEVVKIRFHAEVAHTTDFHRFFCRRSYAFIIFTRQKEKTSASFSLALLIRQNAKNRH